MTVKWNRVPGNWMLWKNRIRQRWDRLTHVHLEAIAGRRDHLLECIQRVYGLNRKNAERELRLWEATLVAAPDESREATELNGREYARSSQRQTR